MAGGVTGAGCGTDCAGGGDGWGRAGGGALRGPPPGVGMQPAINIGSNRAVRRKRIVPAIAAVHSKMRRER